MSKKHFNSIAATIAKEVRGHRYVVDQLEASNLAGAKGEREEHAYAIRVLATTAERLADQFAVFNGNFDRQRFLVACGVRS